MSSAPAPVVPLRAEAPPIRVVTAASLFDGHDAAINIMRRLLQARGAEVIHLGHDRSVDEIVDAAVQEDVHAVAVSSYQGGHMEFFGYLVDRLAERGAGHVRVYGGGGGTITRDEIAALHEAGVAHIFSPEDGLSMGLEGMIDSILEECRSVDRVRSPDELLAVVPNDLGTVDFSQALTIGVTSASRAGTTIPLNSAVPNAFSFANAAAQQRAVTTPK